MSFESYLDEYFSGFDEGDTFLIIGLDNKAIEAKFVEFNPLPIPVVTLYNEHNIRFIITDMNISNSGMVLKGVYDDINYTILDKATFSWVKNELI